jgi:hypothetical protein
MTHQIQLGEVSYWTLQEALTTSLYRMTLHSLSTHLGLEASAQKAGQPRRPHIPGQQKPRPGSSPKLLTNVQKQTPAYKQKKAYLLDIFILYTAGKNDIF